MMRHISLLLLVTTYALTQQPSATTITLGLFSTRTVHNIAITPLSANVWKATCATCQHTPLLTPLHLEHASQTFQVGGNIRMQTEGETSAIEASGIYTITPTPSGLRITLQIPSERYVAAVLSAEAAPDEPAASLEAMAIATRTYALANLGRHKADGFGLCDSTHCQALHLHPVRQAIMQAVHNTAGITLWSRLNRANIYYTQHCGGISEIASTLWPTEHAPYLISHTDPYCLRRNPAIWQTDVLLSDLQRIAAEQHWNLPSPITGIHIAEYTASGRARLLEISGPTRTVSISASSLHFAINRSLGWNRIRSDLYTVGLTNNKLHFAGRGYGHGVGLCQIGAFQMATEHHTAAEILAFYFPSTHVGLTHSVGSWHQEAIGPVTLRTITTAPEIPHAVQLAWQQALALFPLTGQPIQSAVTIAPTTELFRQLTSSPGYLLAVTRGNQITLQPFSILKRNGPIEQLLLHEFLHALIESQSTDKAPLWLREGLAEALSNLHAPYTPATSSFTDIERSLGDPPDQASSHYGHRQAAAIVRMLGHTYSVDVMRKWLRDGVPQQVLGSLYSTSFRR